ncbi:DsbA family protein [Mucilaginibacter pedocola]|uniref:Dithiol-disulfide isomerase n=1 Tax=Mucilaginibacter pedocola TaxID=1792845 RepID=A0A1S9PEY7_9SPHI|nr:DsbA family protein [Mucilaginibacter pedocola]OOQ59523.1 dithiol-disulfide isomerase [Mucilaginibacter pedocola]
MKIYYFTDPMCSWCYGFSPTVKQLKENYPNIDLQIISGGFSPFSKQIVDAEYREFLEYHWRNVNRMSGQYFDHAMKFVSDTFRYDTEPSSRAMVVVQNLMPGKDFEYLSLMQTAFYVNGRDITNDEVLADLAEELGISRDVFFENFKSDVMKRKTIEGFEFSRQLGVQGFPTLLTIDNGAVKVLTRGFQKFDLLKKVVDEQLAQQNAGELNSGQSCADGFCAF